MTELPAFNAIIGVAIAGLGLALAALAVIGMWRTPDGFRPAYAASLIDTVAWTLVALGLALIAWNVQTALLLAFCLWGRLATSALAARALAASAHAKQEPEA
jgi:multisubunit Na+/H+ antiporter MnhG subunit